MGGVRFDLSDTESNGVASKRESHPSESYTQSVRDDTTHKEGDGSEETSMQEIAGRESRNVRRLRVLLILILILAAVAVSGTIFYVTSEAEEESFEAEYNSVSKKVLESFTEIIGEKLGAVDALGAAATSFAIAQNMTWPFVTLNDFVYRTESTVALTESLLLEFLHVVTDDERAEWELYSMTHQEWFVQSLEYQAELYDSAFDMFKGVDLTRLNLPFIWQFDDREEGGSTLGIIPDPGPGPYTASKFET